MVRELEIEAEVGLAGALIGKAGVMGEYSISRRSTIWIRLTLAGLIGPEFLAEMVAVQHLGVLPRPVVRLQRRHRHPEGGERERGVRDDGGRTVTKKAPSALARRPHASLPACFLSPARYATPSCPRAFSFVLLDASSSHQHRAHWLHARALCPVPVGLRRPLSASTHRVLEGLTQLAR